MSKSDEFIDFEKRFREMKESGKLSGEALSFASSLIEALNKTEKRLGEIEDRLMKLEDFSDIISMDIYDIQSFLLKKADYVPGDEEDAEGEETDGHAHCHHDGCDCGCEDEDEDNGNENEASFIRCPFCNTVIFINPEDEELSCPFCGEKFYKSDVED